MTGQEFADGWKHFCKCIEFGNSCLDAEAIRFMNEMPQAVGAVMAACSCLLADLEGAVSLLDGEVPDCWHKSIKEGKQALHA